MPSSSNKHRGQKAVRDETGQLIDAKSKQLLFFQCDVETVKRVPLKSTQEFTQEQAKIVFDKYQKHRQSRSVLYCLIDRIRLQKRGKIGASPFRKHLTYRDIRHFFVFPENPHIFMLCVMDVKGKRTYELYRCKPEDINTICVLTYRASIDPQNIIREDGTDRVLSEPSRDQSTPALSMSADSAEHVDDEEADETVERENLTLPRFQHTPNYRIDRVETSHAPYERILSDCDDSVKSTDIFRKGRASDGYSKSVPNGTMSNGDRSHRSQVTGAYSFYDIHKAVTWQEPQTEHVFNEPRHLRSSPVNIQSSLVFNREERRAHESKFIVPQPRSLDYEIPVGYNRPHCNDQRHKTAERIEIVREYSPATHSAVRKFRSTLDLAAADAITFIGRNSNKDPQIMDNGSFYMYITRYESQLDLRNGGLSHPKKAGSELPVWSEACELNFSNDSWT